jgi:transposase
MMQTISEAISLQTAAKPSYRPRPTAKSQNHTTPNTYKMRNIIERSFNRLKDWRGIATRYDKKAANFLAGICLASAVTSGYNGSTP